MADRLAWTSSIYGPFFTSTLLARRRYFKKLLGLSISHAVIRHLGRTIDSYHAEKKFYRKPPPPDHRCGIGPCIQSDTSDNQHKERSL
jgi:hypothetical protein